MSHTNRLVDTHSSAISGTSHSVGRATPFSPVTIGWRVEKGKRAPPVSHSGQLKAKRSAWRRSLPVRY
ncbi:hypothetical protein ACNKHS_00075 [Shigella flexneri]